MSEFDDLAFALSGRPIDREQNPHTMPLSLLERPEDLADYLRSGREALLRPLRDAPPESGPRPLNGLALAARLTELTDAMLIRLFNLACRKADVQAETAPIAIVATGG